MLIMAKNSACYKCPDRWAKEIDGVFRTCHATCERYAEDRRKDKGVKDAKEKENIHGRYVCMIHNRCVDIQNQRRKSGC